MLWNLGVEGGGIAGLEALVRWQHPELGLLMPGSFIDAAEESSMGDQLADWVARALCRQASEWVARATVTCASRIMDNTTTRHWYFGSAEPPCSFARPFFMK